MLVAGGKGESKRQLKCMTMLRTWPKFRTAAAIAMVQAADHLDEALLNTLYLPLSRTLHLSPTALGGLTMARQLVKVRPRLSYMTLPYAQTAAPQITVAHQRLLSSKMS